MGSPGPSPSISLEDTLGVFDSVDEPGTPLTASEVANRVGCARRTAYRKLDRLADEGTLRTKKVGSKGRVWWVPPSATTGPPRDAGPPRNGGRQIRHEVTAAHRMLDVVPMSLAVVDRDGGFEWANERARERFGGDDADLAVGALPLFDDDGRPVAPEDRPATRVFESGEPVYDWEGQIDLPRGRAWVSVTAIPLDGGSPPERVLVAARDVTTLKEQARRLERQRADLEAELGAVFDRVTDAVYALDEEWRFTYVNERAAEVLQRPAGELLGTSLWEEFPVCAEGPIWEEYHEAMATQEPVSFDLYYRPLEVWVEITAYPSETGLSVYLRDITKRFERERALEESEQRYRTLTEHVPNGTVTLFDEDLRYTLVEGQAFEDLEISADDMTGHTPREVFPGEVGDRLEPAFRAALSGEEQTVELEFEGRTWAVYVVPVRDEDGDPFAGMTLAQDITDRVRRERLLEESERRYRTLVEHFPNGAVGLVDDDLQYTLVGGDFDQVSWCQADFEGRTPGEVWPGDTGAVLESNYRAALDGETNRFEVEFDGQRYRLWTVPVRDEDGEVFAAMGMSQDITERVERERELERVLDLLAKTEQIADVGGWEIDPDTTEVFWTDHIFELLEVPHEEEPPLETALEVYHEDDRPVIERAVETAIEAGECFDVEVRFRTGDGEVRWIRVQGVPETDGDDVVSLRGAAQDITERKAYEQELRRYETLIEKSTDVNAILDPDGTFRYVTPSVEYVLGYAIDELVGDDAFDYIHPDDREEARHLFDTLVERSPRSMRAELRFRSADGSWVWFEARGRNLLDDSIIEGVVVYTRDITDRKASERQLEARARQQAVVSELGREALENPALDGLFEAAARRVTETLDTEYCRILELSDETGDLHLRQGIGWRDDVVDRATVSADDRSQTGYTLQSNAPIVVRDLDEEARFSGADLLAADDATSGISTIIGSVEQPWGVLATHATRRRAFTDEDVTFVQSVANVLAEAIERQAYEDELEALVDELAASNERLKQFAYVASHDLQEPLRMVTSYLQLLERRHADGLDADAREYIEYAVDGATRMRAMIDDLLAYARVDTQAEPLEPTDCAAAVDRVLATMQMRIEECDATVGVEPLPTVAADRNQLEQVFQNLLSNAIKYRGDEPPRIEIGAERHGDGWLFRVADNGIGMEPDRTDRIFDVFHRLHSREDYTGTGIGLALCRRIVERHGGRIWVETAPGEGSTFSFTLPAADRPAVQADAAARSAGGESDR